MRKFILGAVLVSAAAAAAGQGTVAGSNFDRLNTTFSDEVKWTRKWGLGIVDRMSARMFGSIEKASGTRSVGVVLDVTYTARNWRGYYSASLDDASQLQSFKVASDVRCGRSDCEYREAVAVVLPPGYTTARITGFPIRFNAHAGPEIVVNVAAEQVATVNSAFSDTER